MDTYHTFLQQSLHVVSAIANRNFGKVTGQDKIGDQNQVLTETDLEIGQELIKRIQANFPDHNIIDEEAGVMDKNSEFTWVVDPIDGTSNFANGVPTYGVMIGLLEKDQPIAAGLALPAFQEIYLAERGQGATCNDQKLQVTSEKRLASCLVGYGIDAHPEDPKRTEEECQLISKIVLKIRNFRSTNSVFDVAMLVKGGFGGLLNQSSKIWDNVAQQLIIEEAGGTYTDFWGAPIVYTDPLKRATQNFTYCAASPILHQQLQDIILQR